MNKFIKGFLEFCFLGCVIYYLCYHIFSGSYGIMSYQNIQDELEKKKIEYQEFLNDMDKIQNKINRLKLDNLDLDLFFLLQVFFLLLDHLPKYDKVHINFLILLA